MRKFVPLPGALVAQMPELDTLESRAGLEDPPEEGRRTLPVPGMDEVEDVQTGDVPWLVSEDALHRRADVAQLALGAQDRHDVDGVLDQRAKIELASRELLLGRLLPGDVRQERQGARSVREPDERHRRMHGERRAVPALADGFVFDRHRQAGCPPPRAFLDLRPAPGRPLLTEGPALNLPLSNPYISRYFRSASGTALRSRHRRSRYPRTRRFSS